MKHFRVQIGLRTLKTALAVTLSLAAAELTGSAWPIFAAIGAIVAMSRTLGDALTACLTQLAGTVCGCVLGVLFVVLLPVEYPVVVGLGIIVVISVTIRFSLQFATPLSCIVFVSICLFRQGDVYSYALARFIDTSLGLLIALTVNVLVKPYNNRGRIDKVITHFVQTMPDYLRERVIYGRYPDLTPLQRCLVTMQEEIDLYERQMFPNKKIRQRVAMSLRGCQQLAERIYDELDTLCMMDAPGKPSDAQLAQLAAMGITAQREASLLGGAAAHGSAEEDVVLGYHLDKLLLAFSFLCAMHEIADVEEDGIEIAAD